MNDTSAPLVTAVLYAFNEARFVEKAIRSLLAQDYPNLEIVLSDDGSTDGTWEIMQRMAQAYEGPHRVLLNHNETNIGIGSQINAAVAMTAGHLIVLANADDVSHPDRVTRTVQAWLSATPRLTAVWSTLSQIDEAGAPLVGTIPANVAMASLDQAVRYRFGGVLAASLAVDRRIFAAFGPLPANLILEDNPLLARAVLLGRVQRVEEPLVDYRVHADNISQAYAVTEFDQWCARHHQRERWQTTQAVKAYIEMLRDMHQRPAEAWNHADLARARWGGAEKLLDNMIMRDYYAGDRSVGDRVKLRSLLRLVVLVVKSRIKRWFPVIERRNDRWHYREVLQSARKQR